MNVPTVKAELWLAKRLAQHSALTDPEGIFASVSDPATRKERIRAAIHAKGISGVISARGRSGKPVTYAEAFERLYGESLGDTNHSNGEAA